MSPLPAETVARDFFARYNDQNVPAMIDLFAADGLVEYVPLHLEGPVCEVGPGSWGVLIDAFPDLRNAVTSVVVSADGNQAFDDVMIGGTQAKDTFGIVNQGKAYWLRHLFVFTVNGDGKIARVTSFWDSVDWYTQLGKTTLA
jgi:ketosteroid isomerase-like protein